MLFLSARRSAQGFRRSGLRLGSLQEGRVPKYKGMTFGMPWDHDPAWIQRWMSDQRKGKDCLDWFFRAFNRLRLYELFLKSSPRFWGFTVVGAIVIGWYWCRAMESIWIKRNKGRLYKDVPYVYPPEED